MHEQGEALLALGCEAVLMKGGHLDDAESPDWLFTRDGAQRFTTVRIATKNTHGTGCTLSAALAALRPRHPAGLKRLQRRKSGLPLRWHRPIRLKWERVSARFTTSISGGKSETETCQQNKLKKCPAVDILTPEYQA